jgi:uroporphyrin-3 C-methyltransferase
VDQQMSDKETPVENTSSNSSENKQTDKSNAVKASTASAKVDGIKASNKTQKSEPFSAKKITSSKKTEQGVHNNPKTPASKLALLALVIAASAIAASAAHYFWQQEQNLTLLTTISEQRQQAIEASQTSSQKAISAKLYQQLEEKLAQQQQNFNKQLKQVAQQAHQESTGGVKQLSEQVKQLEQQVTLRQPSDWLIHEAEYLIRVAARTMWLERDTKAAIGLLKEADSRLNELQQPKFLPIRALINQDIAALALMPTLENQQAILSLMALNKQIINLPLAGVNLSAALDSSAQESVELSSDINDWQSNLKKTWQQFLKDFITVRRRAGTVEPLMSPEQQQNLKQNLSLKIQLAQWAASEQKADIYQQTLVEMQAWMNEFFDMEAEINQTFYQTIEEVKQHTIYFDFPSDLSSLAAFKRLNNKELTVSKPAMSKPIVSQSQSKNITENLPQQANDTVNKDDNGEQQ